MTQLIFPQLLIFDCDGVLIDSERAIHEILVEQFSLYGLHFDLKDFMSKFSGYTTADITKLIEDENQIILPETFIDSLEDQFFIKLPSLLQAITGIKETLQKLPHIKCVASNAPEKRLLYLLDLLGLKPFFGDKIFSAEKVARPKPFPDLFLFAAEIMEASPINCLVIEDSVVGIKAAKAAGMTALGFTGGHAANKQYDTQLLEAGAMLLFNDMDQLPELLKI